MSLHSCCLCCSLFDCYLIPYLASNSVFNFLDHPILSHSSNKHSITHYQIIILRWQCYSYLQHPLYSMIVVYCCIMSCHYMFDCCVILFLPTSVSSACPLLSQDSLCGKFSRSAFLSSYVSCCQTQCCPT
jgi:hypothetical protein